MAFREEAPTLATSKEFYQQLRGTLETIAPLVQFLNEPLIASQRSDRRSHIFDDE